MKKTLVSVLMLSPALAFAAITQPMGGVDDPTVRVLGGEQRNGTVAIESLETRVTIGADGYSSPGVVFASARDFSGSGAGFSGGVGYSSATADELPGVSDKNGSVLDHIAPGTNGPKLNIVVTPVPEPATYALMGLGLAALILSRKKRI